MMQPIFSPFPVLTTDRLVLRALEDRDVEDIYFLRSDKHVLEFIDRPPATSSADAMTFIGQTRESLRGNESIVWGITLKERDVVIGYLGFWRMEKENYRSEVGYALHPENHRQGIMTEAISAILDYGFGVMGLHSVIANINPGNIGSKELLKKLGFQREAHFRENHFFEGKFLDSEIYVLLDKN